MQCQVLYYVWVSAQIMPLICSIGTLVSPDRYHLSMNMRNAIWPLCNEYNSVISQNWQENKQVHLACRHDMQIENIKMTCYNNKSQKFSKNLSLVWWHFITLFTFHYLIDLWCLLLCIILLPDPSLTNSIHVQCWPTHVLFLPDHDGRGNCYCLCSKIQSVKQPTHSLWSAQK